MAQKMKIDAHFHVLDRKSKGWKKDWQESINIADMLEINQLCISILPPNKHAEPNEFRRVNDDVLQAMKNYPGRYLGYAFVNPGYSAEAVREIERCINAGMVGVKLYSAYTIDDATTEPIIEKCIELGVPILMHAGYAHVDMGQPTLSSAIHFTNIAKKYPEAMLIEAHIGGGGDWEWSIKQLKKCPSVFLDTGGSVVDEGMIEMAIKELGVERILFATDCSMFAGVGKILGANISELQREKVFSGNFQKILAKRKV